MKRVISMTLLCVIIVTFVSCAPSSASDADATNSSMHAAYNGASVQSIYFYSEVIEKGNSYYIVRDLNTDVLYLIVGGYHSGVMSPIYDGNGEVMTYTEFWSRRRNE